MLQEQGKLNINDKLSKFYRSFVVRLADSISIQNLLQYNQHSPGCKMENRTKRWWQHGGYHEDYPSGFCARYLCITIITTTCLCSAAREKVTGNALQ